MFLSVIIPTFKRPESLRLCLEQLTPEIQHLSPDLFEVIVTDDAPDNDQRETLSRDFPWAHHNRAPQKGPAANRNSGAKAACGEWLVFLDDDCIPQPSLLSAYIEAINKNPDYLVFEGSTLAERPRMRLDEDAPINDRGGYLWSCNFAIKRTLFFEVGGFCELYPYACMEDVDFREQLKKRDLKFLFLPTASVIHPWKIYTADDGYLDKHSISHAIFFDRYPLLRPSFYNLCKAILRGWAQGLLKEAPRMKFRGFGGYFSRQLHLTRSQLSSHLASRENNPKSSS
jgi:glycosyltransferase involved in cell wall biosynthesis